MRLDKLNFALKLRYKRALNNKSLLELENINIIQLKITFLHSSCLITELRSKSLRAGPEAKVHTTCAIIDV